MKNVEHFAHKGAIYVAINTTKKEKIKQWGLFQLWPVCHVRLWLGRRWDRFFHDVWAFYQFRTGGLLRVGRKRREDRRRPRRPSKKSPRINFLAAASAPDLSALNNCASDSEQLLCQIFAKCGGRWVAGSELRIAPCAHQRCPTAHHTHATMCPLCLGGTPHPPRHQKPQSIQNRLPGKNVLTCAVQPVQRAQPNLHAIPQKVSSWSAERLSSVPTPEEIQRERKLVVTSNL